MGLRILVVDDEPGVAQTLKAFMQKDHVVSTAHSASSARALLEQDRFDLVICDDRLPEPAGVEFLATVREEQPDAVRVLMSAWVDPVRLTKAINETRVFAFMEKPVLRERLLSTLSQTVQMLQIMRQRDVALEELQRQKEDLERQVAERTRQLADRNKRLEHLAMRDPLTGLFNRRYIEQRMEEELARYKRYGVPFCVMIFDIDDFKSINDSYGHGAGDLVLVGVGDALRTNVRSVDLVARFGGEEFLIVLPSSPQEAGILTAERLCRHVSELAGVEFEGRQLPGVTISGGATQARGDDADWKQVVARADQALYEAKGAGKNRAVTK